MLHDHMATALLSIRLPRHGGKLLWRATATIIPLRRPRTLLISQSHYRLALTVIVVLLAGLSWERRDPLHWWRCAMVFGIARNFLWRHGCLSGLRYATLPGTRGGLAVRWFDQLLRLWHSWLHDLVTTGAPPIISYEELVSGCSCSIIIIWRGWGLMMLSFTALITLLLRSHWIDLSLLLMVVVVVLTHSKKAGKLGLQVNHLLRTTQMLIFLLRWPIRYLTWVSLMMLGSRVAA